MAKFILVTCCFLLGLIAIALISANYCVKNIDRCNYTLKRLGIYHLQKTDPPFVRETQAYLKRMDENVPSGAIIFLGDSHTQSLAVSAVASNSLNFGIGNQGAKSLARFISEMPSLSRAKTIVVAIGINDIFRGQTDELIEQLDQIHQKLPQNVPVVWNTIMPVIGQRNTPDVNREILQANSVIRGKCINSNVDCRIIETAELFVGSNGDSQTDNYLKDGVHMSHQGYTIWINKLRKELALIDGRKK